MPAAILACLCVCACVPDVSTHKEGIKSNEPQHKSVTQCAHTPRAYRRQIKISVVRNISGVNGVAQRPEKRLKQLREHLDFLRQYPLVPFEKFASIIGLDFYLPLEKCVFGL